MTRSAVYEGGTQDVNFAGTPTAQQVNVFLMTDSLEVGGSERQFVALAGVLDRERFQVHVACLQKRGSFLEGLGDVTEFSPGGNLYGVRSIRMRLRLAQYLRETRTAVAHAFDFYSNLVLIPAARMARVPVVIGSQRQLGDLLTPAKSCAQGAMFGWCDAVVCNSRAAAQRLARQGVTEDRIVVIGNGLPPSAFATASCALPHRGGLRVGMIARMNTPFKNHHVLLRAAARLRSQSPETEFVFVGDGQLRPALERQADELGLREQVLFLGERRDITAVLASLDVSVLPSASESLSNVILESMAAGVPVVASRVGGNPELIGEDRGILVAPGDESGLVDAIGRLLLNTSLRTELSRNARQFAESNFTIAQMGERYEELYAELLHAKGRGKVAFSRQQARKRDQQINVAIVAASQRYVGGQSVQATSLVFNWRNDPEIQARLIPIDPSFPRALKWAERVPLLRTAIREPIYLMALWKGLQNSDVAHIFSASYWSFLIAPAPAWLISRLSGKKALIHYHSGEARDHLRRSRVARSVLKSVDELVVPSEYLVGVFREFGLSAQAVPNVVDLSQFRYRARSYLQPHLLCTRGFHPYYRVDLVVRAFAEIQRKFPHARLDLVGRGPEARAIRKLVEQLELANVTFAGVASRQHIGHYYDSADIFINASSLDNMPVSILEAFASGTPVVSTAPEGIRYLVEHERTGLLSEPGDWQALAENVIRLLADPDLSQRIASSAHAESERYQWTAVRQRWREIYRLLARQDHQASRGLVHVA